MKFREFLLHPLIWRLDIVRAETRLLVLQQGKLTDVVTHGVFDMSQALDNITAVVTDLEVSNGALVALTDDIKSKLDAAIAAGNSDPLIQALADRIAAVKAADDATVTKDTPVA